MTRQSSHREGGVKCCTNIVQRHLNCLPVSFFHKVHERAHVPSFRVAAALKLIPRILKIFPVQWYVLLNLRFSFFVDRSYQSFSYQFMTATYENRACNIRFEVTNQESIYLKLNSNFSLIHCTVYHFIAQALTIELAKLLYLVQWA